MSGSVFYTIIVGFTLGVLLRSFYEVGLPEITLFALFSFVCALLWKRTTFSNTSDAYTQKLLFLASVGILSAVMGMARFEYATWQEVDALEGYVGKDVILEGVVDREVDNRGSHAQVYVETGGTVILVFTDPFVDAAYGDMVRLTGTLTEPEVFVTDEARVFNYPAYLRSKGVGYTISFGEIEVVGEGEGNVIVAHLLTFKHRFMKQIENLIPSPEVALGEGLLLGINKALGEDIEEAFRRVGIIHIVVLSGYNVMIVAEAIMRLLAYFFSIRIRMVIGIVVISLFAILVGLGATVVRASIMAGLVLIARAMGKPYAIMRALVFAGVMMLLVNPYLLAFDPGFQLSFLATLGLVLIAPFIEEKLGFVPTKLQIREFVTATLATQLFVLPLLLFSIGTFSIVSVLANVLVLPAVPFAMFFVFVTGVVGFVASGIAFVFAYPAHVLLLYIIKIALFLSELPFAAAHVPAFPFWLLILSYAFLGYLVYWLNVRKKVKSKPPLVPMKPVEIPALEGWTIEEEGAVKANIKEKGRNTK